MPCGYCGDDDCTPLNHYTEEDLLLSNPFLPGTTWEEPGYRPTEDHRPDDQG